MRNRGTTTILTRLEPSARTNILGIFSLGLILFYLFWCTREFVALRLSAQATPAALARAARLEPKSAEIWSRIGRHQLFVFGENDRAAESFRRSLQLDPYDANAWLDLAAAEQLSGRTDSERHAVLRALESDRTTPTIHWRAATYFLSHGEDGAAIEQIKIAAQHSKGLVPDAIHVVWNVTHDASAVLDVLPRTDVAYQQALSYFVRGQQTEAANTAWQRLGEIGAVPDLATTASYTELLITHNQVDRGTQVWSSLCPTRPGSSYCEDGNAIRNGGFEEPLLHQGFDWHVYRVAGMQVGTDLSTSYEGTRSLRIDYGEGAGAEAGLYQFVAVAPNTDYRFSGVYKPDSLSALYPPHIVLDDPTTVSVIATSPDLEGSGGWRPFSVRFNSGPVRLLRIRLLHLPAQGPIGGTLWLDSFKLERP